MNLSELISDFKKLNSDQRDLLINEYKEIILKDSNKLRRNSNYLFFSIMGYYFITYSTINKITLGPMDIENFELIYRIIPLYLAYTFMRTSSLSVNIVRYKYYLSYLYKIEYGFFQESTILKTIPGIPYFKSKSDNSKSKGFFGCVWAFILIMSLFVGIGIILLGYCYLIFTIITSGYKNLIIYHDDFLQWIVFAGLLILLVMTSLSLLGGYKLLKTIYEYNKIETEITNNKLNN